MVGTTHVNSNLTKLYNLGTSTSFNIKTLLPNIDYTKLTADNFFVSNVNAGSGVSRVHDNSNYGGYGEWNFVKSYNNTTGILTSYLDVVINARREDGYMDSSYASAQNCAVNAYLII